MQRKDMEERKKLRGAMVLGQRSQVLPCEHLLPAAASETARVLRPASEIVAVGLHVLLRTLLLALKATGSSPKALWGRSRAPRS